MPCMRMSSVSTLEYHILTEYSQHLGGPRAQQPCGGGDAQRLSPRVPCVLTVGTLSTHSGYTAHHCHCNVLHRERARTAAKARRGTMSTHSRNPECSQCVSEYSQSTPRQGRQRRCDGSPVLSRTQSGHSFLGGFKGRGSVSDGTTQTARDLPCGQPKWVL